VSTPRNRARPRGRLGNCARPGGLDVQRNHGAQKAPSDVTSLLKGAANRGRTLLAGVIAGAWLVGQVVQREESGSVPQVERTGRSAVLEGKPSTRASSSSSTARTAGSRGPSWSSGGAEDNEERKRRRALKSPTEDGARPGERGGPFPRQGKTGRKERGLRRADREVRRPQMAH